MPRFVAVPVGQGDAFFLDKGGWSALVDGGRSISSFASVFQNTTHTDSVNVLVCTHNDADHTNGVIGFLESGLRCDEVWLPGRWLGAVAEVLQPFINVSYILASEISHDPRTENSTRLRLSGTTAFERYADLMHDSTDADRVIGESQETDDDGWTAGLRGLLEQAESWQTHPSSLAPYPGFLHPDYRGVYGLTHPVQWELLWSAIEAADRIRRIALAAFHHGIRVRWFEYEPFHPIGVGGAQLQPVNARVIAQVRPFKGTLLRLLALTVSNRESLVFWSPSAQKCPGVLFTADSDLQGVQLPSGISGSIVTAPHHGSEANANAYSAISGKGCQDVTWVRSDGRYMTRPGKAYLQLSDRRLCTICRLATGKSSRKQAVELFTRKGIWVRKKATAVCGCQ